MQAGSELLALVPGQVATVRELKARWAYSEQTSSRASSVYRQHRLDGLDEMAARGVDFDLLQPGQKRRLAELLHLARIGLPDIVDRHQGYMLQLWSEGRLCQASTISHFNTPAQKYFMPYFDFLHWARDIGPNGTEDPADPRIVADSVPVGAPSTSPWGAIAVAEFPNVIVDGYLRSILFMRDAPRTATLPVWVPLDSNAWRVEARIGDD
jgi:hypothetical protein